MDVDDKIKVFDNLFPTNFIDEVHQLVFYSKVPYDFLYNVTSTKIKDKPLVGFQHILFDQTTQLIPSSFNNFLLNILYRTAHQCNLQISQYYRGRIFIQPPKDSSVLSGIHKDLKHNHLVCLYYINDVDGDTIFYDNDYKTEIKRLSPKKGRVAIFDGNIPHAATTPTTLPRGVVNFNFSS
jgi:hypothetical protein